MVTEKSSGKPLSRDLVVQNVENAKDPIAYLREAADSGYKLPRHVGIIMDGNGRWAERHKYQSVTQGHQKGADTIVGLLRDIKRLFPYIETVTLWALSPDNIKNRSRTEISGLMHIINNLLLEVRDETMQSNGRIIHIGQKQGLADFLQHTLSETEAVSKSNTGQKVVLAVNFNGEQNVLRTTNEAIAHATRRGISTIDSATLKTLQDPFGIGQPDLIIRTGTEATDGQSLSGWGLDGPGTQLVFTPTLLPDFSTKEMATLIAAYQQRRMGGRPATKL